MFENIRNNINQPIQTRVVLLILGVLVTLGGIALLVQPASAASNLTITGNIIPQLSFNVDSNPALYNWTMIRHQNNVVPNGIGYSVTTDSPVVMTVTSSHGGRMWNAARSTPLTFDFVINNKPMNSGSVVLRNFTESGIPQMGAYNVSQALNGDLPGSYSIDLNFQLEVQ